jgi:chromate reductase
LTANSKVYRVGLIPGSLRRESYSRKLAQALTALMPEGLEAKVLTLEGLALYNQDLDDEGTPPPAWVAFRQAVKALDGVLFVTPEYNRSIPAVLKNALDIGSRPYGQGVWNGKPGGVLSISPGKLGGFGANLALRQAVVFLDIHLMQQPEAYLGGAESLLGPDGALASPDTEKFLRAYLEAFARWVRQILWGSF